MPSKPSQKKTDPTAVVAPEVVAPAPATEPSKKSKAPKVSDEVVAEKKAPKAKTSPKSEVSVAPEPVPTPVCEMDNVVVSDALEHSITTGFTDFIGRFQSMITQFNTLKTELRNLEKATSKQLKIAQKLNNKKRRKGSRAPSGFVRPSLISEELATFLGKPAGSEMARTDVTREINK